MPLTSYCPPIFSSTLIVYTNSIFFSSFIFILLFPLNREDPFLFLSSAKACAEPFDFAQDSSTGGVSWSERSDDLPVQRM